MRVGSTSLEFRSGTCRGQCHFCRKFVELPLVMTPQPTRVPEENFVLPK